MRATITRYLEALKKRRSSDEGFSLIELIVVVAILGILVAIAIPVFNGLQETAEKNAVQAAAANGATQVASKIAAKQTVAIPASNDEFTLSFDPAGTPATVDSVCVKAVSENFVAHAGPACTAPGVVPAE